VRRRKLLGIDVGYITILSFRNSPGSSFPIT